MLECDIHDCLYGFVFVFLFSLLYAEVVVERIVECLFTVVLEVFYRSVKAVANVSVCPVVGDVELGRWQVSRYLADAVYCCRCPCEALCLAEECDNLFVALDVDLGDGVLVAHDVLNVEAATASQHRGRFVFFAKIRADWQVYQR